MISVWWGVKGVVHWELLPEKSTITASTYRTQLIKLSTKLKDNRTEKGKIYFQHDIDESYCLCVIVDIYFYVFIILFIY